MKIKTFIVDAFTDVAFKGNQAGVCLIEQSLAEDQMQAIAAELNFSETAFVLQQPDGPFAIRYFSPTVEVAFCGHATLASARVVINHLGYDEVSFLTHHGLSLTARKDHEAITMEFPLYDTVEYTPADELFAALGVSPRPARYAADLRKVLIEVADKAELAALQPDFARLKASTENLMSVIVTCAGQDDEYDFYSRCFCPWVGINEDPVTGSAHTVLAKYWADKLGNRELTAYQLSSRGGYLKLFVRDDKTLAVTSNALMVLAGELAI